MIAEFNKKIDDGCFTVSFAPNMNDIVDTLDETDSRSVYYSLMPLYVPHKHFKTQVRTLIWT